MKSEAPSIRSFKGVFIGINTIMGLIGFTCFAVGIHIRYSAQPTEADVRATMAVAYLLIFGGFFSMLISVLGCLGAVLESNCILVLYFFITVAMFILLIAIGIYSFKQVHASAVEEAKYISSVKKYLLDSAAKEFVDNFHFERNCCGMREPEIEFNGTIPSTCKPISQPVLTGGQPAGNSPNSSVVNTTDSNVAPHKVYRSCIYHGSVRDYMATAGGLTLGFAVIVLLCAVGVVFLCSAIRSG